MVCFDHNGHGSGVHLEVVYGARVSSFEVQWNGEVTEQMRKSYGDLLRATDNAACAIALLLVRELTPYTGIEQSAIGTTFDYYLGMQDNHSDLIFNHSARLEISGILNENPTNSVKSRVNDKIRRLSAEYDLPSFVVVVEFSKPWSAMVEL